MKIDHGKRRVTQTCRHASSNWFENNKVDIVGLISCLVCQVQKPIKNTINTPEIIHENRVFNKVYLFEEKKKKLEQNKNQIEKDKYQTQKYLTKQIYKAENVWNKISPRRKKITNKQHYEKKIIQLQ